MQAKLFFLLTIGGSLFADSNAAVKNCFITVPQVFRPGVASSVQFDFAGLPPSPISVNVTILSYPSQANTIATATQALSQQNETIRITVPSDTPEDIYYIKVVSTSDLVGSTWSYMIVKQADNFLFVETDKPIYRRGERVRVRVFATTPSLRPILSDVVLEYYDPSNARFARLINRAATRNGLFTADFFLSPRAAVGDWTIRVYSKDSKSNLLNYNWKPIEGKRVFTVYDYDIPHFDLSVKLPPYLSKDAQWINGSVEAKYRTGKAVGGRIRVGVHFVGLKVDRTTEVFDQFEEYTISALKGFAIRLQRGIALENKQILVNVTLNDYQTDMFYTKLISVPFSETVISFKTAISSPNYIIPGKQFIPKFVITARDGSPFQQISGLKIDYISSNGGKGTADIAYGTDGKPYCSISTLLGAQSITFNRVFLNDVNTPIVDAILPPVASNIMSTYYIEIKPTTNDQITVNGAAKFAITTTDTTFPITVTYLVMSKGVIRSTSTVQMTTSETIITVGITAEMTPFSRLLVYYWRAATDEYVANQIRFEVNGSVANTVSLTFSPQVTEGDVDVNLIIKAKPNSLVALSIINADLLLLKPKGDNFANDLSDVVDRWEQGPDVTFKDKTAADIFFDAGVAFFRSTSIVALQYGKKRSTRQAPSVQDPPVIIPPDIEVLYWNEVQIGDTGILTLTITIPAHLRNASYVANAYAINDKDGFGPADSLARLDVVPKNYSITINAPSTVARNDLFLLQVAIINHSPFTIQPLTVDLTYTTNFDLVSTVGNTAKSTNVQRKNLDSGYDTAITFPLQAKTLGSMLLTVQVTLGINGQQKITQHQITVNVKPEGVEDSMSKSVVITLASQQIYTTRVNLDTPGDMVPNSGRVIMNAFLYPMDHSVSNMESLIQQPYGCGEQTLINLTPIIYISLYLQSVGKFDGNVKVKALYWMNCGYLREMGFQNPEGGIAVWTSYVPSTWLTAFALRSFMQAQQFICVDLDSIAKMMTFIIRRQQSDGSFTESFAVYHAELQSGTRSGIAYSAFILIAIVEKDNILAPRSVIDKATAYLEGQQSNAFGDAYVVAIVTYALHLVKSTKKDTWFNELERLATTDAIAGTKYWQTRWGTSTVESTGYAVLTYLLRGNRINAFPLVTYLLNSRNAQGGFYSTPDTSIGLQALSAYYISYTSGTSMTITLSGTISQQFNLNGEITPKELNYIPTSFNLTANGEGMALFQISIFFNRLPPAAKAVGKRAATQPANMTATPQITTSVIDVKANNITIRTCIRFVSLDTISMTLAQIYVPAGFNIIQSQIENMLNNVTLKATNLSYVEYRNNKLNLYFNVADGLERCVDIFLDRFESVQVPYTIFSTVSDYYRPERHGYAKVELNSTCLVAPGDNMTACPPPPMVTTLPPITTTFRSSTTTSRGSKACFSSFTLNAGLLVLLSVFPMIM